MKRPRHSRERQQRQLNGLMFVLLASHSCCSTVARGHSNRGNNNNNNNVRRRLVQDNIFDSNFPSQSEQPSRSLLPTILSMSQSPSKTPSHTPREGQHTPGGKPPSDDNGGSSSSSIGLIAGVSAAGALLLVAALGFLRCRRAPKVAKSGKESEKSRRTREHVMELIERKDWRGLHTAAREATGKEDQAMSSEASLPRPSDDLSSSKAEMDATAGRKSPGLGEYLARSSAAAAASPKKDECENDETTESSSTTPGERQKQAIQINKVQEPAADMELDKVNRGSYWSNDPNEASDDPFRARLKELAQEGDYKNLLLALEDLQHTNSKDGSSPAQHSNRPKKSRSKRRKYRGSDPPDESSDDAPFKSYLDEVHETSSRSVGYATGGLEDIMESEDEQFEDTDTDGGMSASTDEVECTLETFSKSRSRSWGKKTNISTRKSSRNNNKGNLKDPASYDDQSEGDFTSLKVTERSWDGLVSGINDPYSADVFGEPFYTGEEQSRMMAK